MEATTERTYTTEDKSSWGDGPWQQEPDKVQFVDEVTGLPCLIVRGPSGALCGYVGVSEGHPLFGLEYYHFIPEWCACSGEHVFSLECEPTPEERLKVHGGITYARACQDGPEDSTICHVPAPGEPDHVWWFGFDCAHSEDLCPATAATLVSLGVSYQSPWPDVYRDMGYVRQECASLAEQIHRYRHNLTPTEATP